MKIGILTHPLHNNYGGLLQAYALQTVLKRMGHEVLTLYTEQTPDRTRYIIKYTKYIVKKVIGKKPYAPLSFKQRKTITKNTDRFVEKYMSVTKPLFWVDHNIHEEYEFDAYIVGSDQVWRPSFVHNIRDMFFNFLKDKDTIRIAYAASFGTSDWEYSAEEEFDCQKLIEKFDAVSVREDSGIELCKTKFNIKPIHLLDPTMLLSKQDYKSLYKNKTKSSRQLTAYLLDISAWRLRLLENIAHILSMEITYIGNPNADNKYLNYKQRIIPDVESWISGIDNADFVITDSFHGCVFSIIFNKQFIAIGNNKRGLDRFTSLFKMFGLENRLIMEDSSYTNIEKLIRTSIIYDPINIKINAKRKEAKEFLSKSLKKSKSSII